MTEMDDRYSLEPASTGSYDHLIADLIFNTDPSVFGCLVREDRKLFSRWITPLWQSAGCSYGFDCATVLMENSDLLGFELGFAGELHGLLEEKSAAKGLSVFNREQLVYLANCSRHLNYVVPFVPKSAYYVHLLSIRAERQGTGIGRRLLENAFEQASENGFKSVHLDVYEGNPAVGFYERMGMQKRLETRLPAFQDTARIPAHFRMVKEL